MLLPRSNSDAMPARVPKPASALQSARRVWDHTKTDTDALHRAGKRTYTFLMGKPNPAKLANFPEEGLQYACCCNTAVLLCWHSVLCF